MWALDFEKVAWHGDEGPCEGSEAPLPRRVDTIELNYTVRVP